MTKAVLEHALARLGIGFRTLAHKQDEINLDCPFCNDTRRRFFLNVVKRVGYCHNESKAYSLASVLAALNIAETPRDAPLLKMRLHELGSLVRPAAPQECDRTTLLPPVAFPDFTEPITHGSVPSTYLKRRGVTEALIKEYDIRWCYDGVYVGRVIIPIYDPAGRMVGFTARDVVGESKRKYLFPPNMKKAAMLFNAQYIHNTSHVVLVEGAIPAMVLGHSFMATFGKSLSAAQEDMLKRFGVDRITLLWDCNAAEDMKRAHYRLSTIFRCKYVVLPYGQPDDFSKEQIYSMVNKVWCWNGVRYYDGVCNDKANTVARHE